MMSHLQMFAPAVTKTCDVGLGPELSPGPSNSDLQGTVGWTPASFADGRPPFLYSPAGVRKELFDPPFVGCQ